MIPRNHFAETVTILEIQLKMPLETLAKTLCKDFDGQGRQLASKIGGATGHFSQLYTASLVVRGLILYLCSY